MFNYKTHMYPSYKTVHACKYCLTINTDIPCLRYTDISDEHVCNYWLTINTDELRL